MVFSFDSCIKHIDNLDTTNSLEEGDSSSMNRRELVTWFVTSLFAMGTQSVLAQENGKEREKPTISMEDFMKELNEKSTYEKADMDWDGGQSAANNLLLIHTIFQKYNLTNDDLNKVFKKFFNGNSISLEEVYELEETLFQKWYFLHLLNKKYWGWLLQKWSIGTSTLSDNNMIQWFFWTSVSDIEIPTIIINDTNFQVFWYTTLGQKNIVLNKVKIDLGYQGFQKLMKGLSNPVFSKLPDPKSYFNTVLVNELCHAVLFKKYGFSKSSQIPWKRELGEKYIDGLTDSSKISEFLSDVVSFMWLPREQAFIFLLTKSLNVNIETYRLSRILLFRYIHVIFAKKTNKNPEIDFILRVIFLSAFIRFA